MFFFDISIAFNKVWHDGLIFKLKENGVSSNLQHISSDFLSNRSSIYCSYLADKFSTKI